MSLINVKRTLESAEGTMENIINDKRLWEELLQEYPDEVRRLFDSLMEKAVVLARGSNKKSQYWVGKESDEKTG
jgi:hypothetical protein